MMKERTSLFIGGELLKPGEIPVGMVYGRSLPEAWEDSVLGLWELGTLIPTEYDKKGDPDSRDASLTMVIADPMREPRIHRAMPAPLDELLIYSREVVDGVRDHWVGERGWSYTYHERIYGWPGKRGWQRIEELVDEEIDYPYVDQINVLMEKLAQTPHSRRAQATTWHPLNDAYHHEPPCLQRIWCRVAESEEGRYLLEMNTHWRSRDALKAAFMNLFAMSELQAKMARSISELSGREVGVGRMADSSDSYHIYGAYVRKPDEETKSYMERFLHYVGSRDLEGRTFRTDDRIVQVEFGRGQARLDEERRNRARQIPLRL